MQRVSTQLTYSSTGFFSPIVLDYLQQAPSLQPFYQHPATADGIKAGIAARKRYKTGRELLVNVLEEQYKGISLTGKQQQYMEELKSENTFTVCTAHQPNIFTGHLYFIYKILHAVKLAESLRTEIPGNNFVPVYYMGSEDADIDELGHIYLDGQKYEWKTGQKGAVGRMKVDQSLTGLIDAFSGQLLVHPFGKELEELMRRCYVAGATIEQATFQLVNELFAKFGLLILLPDNPALKRAFAPVMERELLEQFSHQAVSETVAAFPEKYKVQAAGRAINLFYLKDDIRERIEWLDGEWVVVNTEIKFSREELLTELKAYPERFSPNVILRPLFQEMLLPNVAFIGGGGELAYWLELKKVFEAAEIPYPVQVLRNSFLLIDAKSSALMEKLHLDIEQIFKPETDIINMLVKRDSVKQLDLEQEKKQLRELYSRLQETAANVDVTLRTHTEALCTKALQKITALEKKMLRAEKRQFEAQQNQLQKLKKQLFPHNNLQERVENFMLYYSKSGQVFIQSIYEDSLALQQEFRIIRHSLPAKTESPQS